MFNSLEHIGNMHANDSFYNESDDEAIGDNASDGGGVDSINGDAGDELVAAKAPLPNIAAPAAAAKTTTVAAGAPAGLTPLPVANKMKLDATAAAAGQIPVSAMQQFAQLIAASLRGTAATFAIQDPGVKRKTLKLVFEGSLDDVQNGRLPARLVPEVKDIGRYFGADTVAVTKMRILGYDFTGAPITAGIKAPEHMKAAQHDHLSVAGPVLFEAERMTKKEFAEPHVVYIGVESEVKKQILKDYPNVTVKNVYQNVKEGIEAGMVLVPYKDIVAAAVVDEIAHQKSVAAAAGATYTGPELNNMRVDPLKVYNIPKPLVTRAVNTLISTLISTDDSFDLKSSLYFDFARTVLSSDTVEKKMSSTAPLWVDKREISQFIKGAGATLEAFTKTNFTASITIDMEYTCANAGAADAKK